MNLDSIRADIDDIDHELVNLFQMRMNLVAEVANYKTANNIPVFNPEREKEILNNLIPEGELGCYTKDFLESIFEISKKYQSLLIVQEG
ncbi:MAG: chorismate mutase [Peptostreptococcaceae bacterium]|nr:chorismate mutase [Peptostreptococcaceae bacterium]